MFDTEEKTYAIYRHYMKSGKEFVKGGLTLEEAQDHCKDPETSSSTASSPDMSKGPWFDGYDEE
jgi:hypothetical protein